MHAVVAGEEGTVYKFRGKERFLGRGMLFTLLSIS